MKLVDVLIAGGGSAGLAAAIASARAGARTVLVERQAALGGMATNALVHSICGLYLLHPEPDARFAHPGFPTEFARRLIAAGGACGPVRMGRVDVLPTHPPSFAALADALCAAEPNLTVLLHTKLLSTLPPMGNRLTQVELSCGGNRFTLFARAFVDATGDAVLSAMAGAQTEQAPTLQRPAFIFALGGVDTVTLQGQEGIFPLLQRMVAAVRSGELPQALQGAHLRLTGRPGEIYVTIDLDDPVPGEAFNPFSAATLTAMEQHGRRLAQTLHRHLAGTHPLFKHAYIAAFPGRIGVRESRRVVGEARIETEDLLAGATAPDAVALSTWPIELRETATGPRLRYPAGPCQIPLGALRPKGFQNLFVAGRCISSSHDAQAALRVIGTCLATGEAAGIAAALQAQQKPVTAEAVRQVRKSITREPACC